MGEWQKHIDNLNRILKDDKIHRLALSTVLVAHKKRIFQSGFDKNNQRIGTYSTKKASIKGQTYTRGYAEYKAQKGKNPGFVILDDTSDLRVGYVLQVLKPNAEYAFGHTNVINYEKTQWLEAKYKKQIFFSSTEERKLLTDTIQAQVNRELQR